MKKSNQAAAAAAQAAFNCAYPDWEAIETKEQGQEGNTRYFAIIFRSPLLSRPLPYKLFAVSLGTAVEVNIAEYLQFAFKGRK